MPWETHFIVEVRHPESANLRPEEWELIMPLTEVPYLLPKGARVDTGEVWCPVVSQTLTPRNNADGKPSLSEIQLKTIHTANDAAFYAQIKDFRELGYVPKND